MNQKTTSVEPPLLSCQKLRCEVAGRTILEDVNLTVGEYPMTAIIGVNGAGKSTLLRALAGIDQPADGEVQLSGTPLRRLSARKRAQQLAYVSQSDVPPAEMNVFDFVSLARLPYQGLLGGNSAADIAEITQALTRVGLFELRGRSCGQLSGGQLRRVCLARGLAQASPLLLLDEPTNHLDVHHQQLVLQIARHGQAQVVAAIHDLDLVMNHFDRVIVLHQGQVIADGQPAQVLTEELVAEVFQVEAHQMSSPRGRNHLLIDAAVTPLDADSAAAPS